MCKCNLIKIIFLLLLLFCSVFLVGNVRAENKKEIALQTGAPGTSTGDLPGPGDLPGTVSETPPSSSSTQTVEEMSAASQGIPATTDPSGAGTGTSAGTGPGSSSGAGTTTGTSADSGGSAVEATTQGAGIPEIKSLKTEVEKVKEVWKWALSLIDYLLVFFLIFVAMVNILRIQVDLYEVKKALPGIILGVILANFSWFVCMALIELATAIVVWEQSMMGGSVVGALYHELMGPVVAAGFGIGALAAIIGAFSWGLGGLALFFVGLIALFIPIILFIIVYFLLFIRIYVVDFLVIASPLAFMMLGFPLTTQYFKQWWDQFVKWVFLAPLALFLWVIAYEIAKNMTGDWALAKYVLICAVIYFSIRVPFMLGGAIMAGWAGLGAFITGTGKGGFARKPVEDYMTNTRKMWGAKVSQGIDKTFIGGWRAGAKLQLETTEAAAKASQQTLERKIRAKAQGTIERKEQEIKMASGLLEKQKQDNLTRLYEGQLGRKYGEYEAGVSQSQMKLEKRQEDARVGIAIERLRNFGELSTTDPALEKAAKDLDNAKEALTRAKTPTDRTNALTAVETAEKNLQTEKKNVATKMSLTQINPDTKKNYTEKEAIQYLNETTLGRLERSRYFAIANKRGYDDAKDIASSTSSERLALDIMKGSVGPNKWDNSHATQLFNGQNIDDASAAFGFSENMEAVKIHLHDTTTKGVMLKGYSQQVRTVNSKYYDEAFARSMDLWDQNTKKEIEEAIKQQKIGNGKLNAENFSQVVLNTSGSFKQRGAADIFITTLQSADTNGGFLDNSGKMVATGNSGLSKSIGAYTEKVQVL